MVTVFVLQVPLMNSNSTQTSSSWMGETQHKIYNDLVKINPSADTRWIQESEIMALRTAPTKKAIFVLPVFGGDTFCHLEKLKCRIYGSYFFLQTVNCQRSLPNHFCPVYSSILDNVVVCFTGISSRQREEKAILVQYMCGRVCRQFDNSVTHLVADFCDPSSEKYRATRKMKLPVVSSTWIDELWKISVDGGDISDVDFAEILRVHTLPIFRGCVITVSGFDANEILNIGQLVELNGGVYSGEMSKATCTHLIASRNSGAKFHKAVKWGTVKIVDLRWLKKSIELGHRLSEEKFSRVESAAAVPSLSWAKAPPPIPPDVETACHQIETKINRGSNQIEEEQVPSTSHILTDDSIPVAEKAPIAGEKEGTLLESTPPKKATSVFELVEKFTKEVKEQQEIERRKSNIIIADKRRRTSMAGTIRTRKSFTMTTIGANGPTMTAKTSAQVTAAAVMLSPAKLPGEELDSSQKDKSVMEWVEQCVRQREINSTEATKVLGDSTNLQRRKIARPKNMSTPLGEMVVNMHQQLLSKQLPLQATEFKKEILDVIEKFEVRMFDETKK